MARVPNKIAVISGIITESVTDAGELPGNVNVAGLSMISGHLTITDEDPGQAAFATPRPSSMSGDYGQFSFTVGTPGTLGTPGTGDWIYRLNSAKADAIPAGQTQEDRLILTSLDGKTSETIRVTINGTNDAPTLTAGKAGVPLVEMGSADSGTANSSITFTKTDPDLGDTADWNTTGWIPDTLPTFHKAGVYGTANFNTSTGIVSYVLDNNLPGTNALNTSDTRLDSFQVKVEDDLGVARTATAVFTIKGRNDAPVGSADTLHYTKNTVVRFEASDLLGNDHDVDNLDSALSIARVTNGTGGTVKLGSHNTVIFTPTRDFEGDAHFTYIVTDGKASSQAVDVTVSIPTPADTTAPDAPTLSLNVDSGVDDINDITNDSSYTIGGLEPNATVEYSTTGLGGSWSEFVTVINDQALNTVYVRQTDLAGNVSPASAPLSFTLDTVAPVMPIGNEIASVSDSQLVLNFIELFGLDESANNTSGFTVTVNGVGTVAVNSVFVSAANNTVELTFDAGALVGSGVSIAYDGTSIADMAGNWAPAFFIDNIVVP